MKKTIIILLITSIYSFGQKNNPPNGYKIMEEKTGDLDKDGVPEKVIVYDTNDTTDYGTRREIQILKQNANKWIMWKRSGEAILKSEEGGMMGDPYGGIEIKNGILLIHHSGGSGWKWSYTDKYRFQNNEFELIGYTSNYGMICEYWATIDFNVSTGKINYKKEAEACDRDGEVTNKTQAEAETFYEKGISLNLNNRHSKEIKIVSPKFKYELYL